MIALYVMPVISPWVVSMATSDRSVSQTDSLSAINSLSEIINSLLDEVELFGAAAVDGALARIDVTRARDSHLVAVLSTLFTWRSELPSWTTLRDRTVVELGRRGFDNLDVAMQGLL